MRFATLRFRAPTLTVGCLLACAAAAQAQYVVNPDRLPGTLGNLEWRPDDKPLACSVSFLKPALNFGFRFQSGYIVRVPMAQYRGKGHRLTMVARVTPEGGKPVWLMSRYGLPDVPKTTVEIEVGGGFLIGEGKYAITWKLQDETGRVCRDHAKFEAKLKRSESKVKVAMEPHTVSPFANWTVGGKSGTDDAPPIRLTVLMHASPTSPRRTRMNVRDRVMLLGTLSSLLERVPTRSVRLVVFNLDQQKELYRQDDFTTDAFNDVAQAVDGAELGLVDYRVLQNKRGHVDLLAEMVNQEVAATQPADVVLFLGPMSRYIERVSDPVFQKPSGPAPRFFYFQYRSPFMRMESTLPDVIHSAVSKLKGKTVVIHTPGDFAKGIEQVERLK